ncbi:MAG TPA: SMI1/KNR4 family protein, partial [Pseudoneobacillus sp.]|nr:SMI1/KNR4 family protein [Pseudoneobacillus sp.]
KFPEDYIEFMLSSNGGEGQINERYLRLWEMESIVEANGVEGYSIEEFAPGLVVIGSDGGGTAFGYDFRSETPKLVEVDFIGLNIDTPFYSTEKFFDFIQYLHNDHYEN